MLLTEVDPYDLQEETYYLVRLKKGWSQSGFAIARYSNRLLIHEASGSDLMTCAESIYELN